MLDISFYMLISLIFIFKLCFPSFKTKLIFRNVLIFFNIWLCLKLTFMFLENDKFLNKFLIK